MWILSWTLNAWVGSLLSNDYRMQLGATAYKSALTATRLLLCWESNAAWSGLRRGTTSQCTSQVLNPGLDLDPNPESFTLPLDQLVDFILEKKNWKCCLENELENMLCNLPLAIQLYVCQEINIQFMIPTPLLIYSDIILSKSPYIGYAF